MVQWNIVTSLAVTFHAWMTPVDRLIFALNHVQSSVSRKHTEVCSAVFVSCLEHIVAEAELPLTQRDSLPSNKGLVGVKHVDGVQRADLLSESEFSDKYNITSDISRCEVLKLAYIFFFNLVKTISHNLYEPISRASKSFSTFSCY